MNRMISSTLTNDDCGSLLSQFESLINNDISDWTAIDNLFSLLHAKVRLLDESYIPALDALYFNRIVGCRTHDIYSGLHIYYMELRDRAGDDADKVFQALKFMEEAIPQASPMLRNRFHRYLNNEIVAPSRSDAVTHIIHTNTSLIVKFIYEYMFNHPEKENDPIF